MKLIRIVIASIAAFSTIFANPILINAAKKKKKSLEEENPMLIAAAKKKKKSLEEENPMLIAAARKKKKSFFF